MYYDANLSIFTLVFKCLIYFNYAITNIIFTARQGGSIKIFKLGVSVWREQRHLPLCTDSNSTYICLYSIYTDTASIHYTASVQNLHSLLSTSICLYTAFFQPRFASIQPLLNIHLPLSKLQSTFIWLFTTSIWPSFKLHLSECFYTVFIQTLSVSIQSPFNIYLPLYSLQSTSVCLYTVSIQHLSASIQPPFNLHLPLSDTASIQLLHRICTAFFQPRIASIQYIHYTAFINIHLPLNRLQSTFVCLYTTSI